MASDQEQLRLSRQTLGAFEETLRLTREQFRVGIGSELEVRQADTNYQGAVSDIAALEAAVALDQNALNLLVGTTVPQAQLPSSLAAEPATRDALPGDVGSDVRSEEHTSELQSLMRISYAVFCLKKKK